MRDTNGTSSLIPACFAAVFFNLAEPGKGVHAVAVSDIREVQHVRNAKRTHRFALGASCNQWRNGFPQVEALWDELEDGYGFLTKAERRRALHEFGKIDTAIWARRMLAEPLSGLGGDADELRALRRKIDSGQYVVDLNAGAEAPLTNERP